VTADALHTQVEHARYLFTVKGNQPSLEAEITRVPATAFPRCTNLLLVATPFAGLHAPHLRWDAVAAVTILGTLGTGAAYVLNYRLITDEGTTASVGTYLLPVVAVILGATVLVEPLTAQVIAGVIVVLAGVALTRGGADRPHGHTAPPAPEPPPRLRRPWVAEHSRAVHAVLGTPQGGRARSVAPAR